MRPLSSPRVDSWEDAGEEVAVLAPWGERNRSPSLHGLAFSYMRRPFLTPVYMGPRGPCLYIDVIGLNQEARVYRRGVGFCENPIRPPINYIMAKAYHMARRSRNMGM